MIRDHWLPSTDSDTFEVVDRKAAERTIARVEDFLERLRDMDLVTTPQGQRMTVKYPDEKEEKSLAAELGHTIVFYEEYKVMFPNLDDPAQLKIRFQSAHTCQILIDKALMWGAFQPSEGLLRKYRECSEKVTKLQTDLATLSANYEGLRRLLAQQGRPDAAGGRTP